MLTLVRDLQSCPQILNARLSLERWRFYHTMRTDADAPARKPVRGFWSPVLNEDASNLPAVIQSINESDLAEAFHEAMAKAFPDSRLEVDCGDWFSLAFHAHSLPRPLHGHELSDGTLQFICLAAVLCSPRPPPLLVLNEPETSLNEPVPDKLVVLTFDDSVASQANYVAPLLKKHGFGATFFITEGFEFLVDKKNYMTWEQIKALHDQGSRSAITLASTQVLRSKSRSNSLRMWSSSRRSAQSMASRSR
jgi:hypothetical protein